MKNMEINLFASEEMFPRLDQSGANGRRYRQPALWAIGLAIVSALESDESHAKMPSVILPDEDQ